MTTDALDPGPNGDYPYWPRDEESGTRMPTGLRWARASDGRLIRIDVTPRHRDGRPIDPDDPDNLPAP
ncbi:hypothetical protein BH23ACT8_BH23ACT8_15670 [soil metagenome]